MMKESNTSKSSINTEKYAHLKKMKKKVSTLFLLFSFGDLDQNTCRQCVYTTEVYDDLCVFV